MHITRRTFLPNFTPIRPVISAHAASARRPYSSVRQFLIYSTLVLVWDYCAKDNRSALSLLHEVSFTLQTTNCRRRWRHFVSSICWRQKVDGDYLSLRLIVACVDETWDNRTITVNSSPLDSIYCIYSCNQYSLYKP